jgi:transcription initiation factor TFIID TATA-box-binding protein
MNICNIIASLNSNQSLDLKKIAAQCSDKVKYKPGKFPGLSLKFQHPKATILLFRSGKMVCIGVKNEDDVRESFRKILEICQIHVDFIDFKIHNYVGSNSIGYCIDLRKFYEKFKSLCLYEPEIFPGLTYKMVNQKITVILFSSGKFIITGSKMRSDLFRADIILRRILGSFK